MARLLLLSIFVISTCGLIYELIAGTLASYLLGDSITQFSTIIGVYLFAMGVGSYLSKFIEHKLIETFIRIELLIGFLGGSSTLALYLSFQYIEHFKILLYTFVFLIGACVGLEIPLMMRILKSHYQDFKDLISKVFTFDYIGALIASLLFPLFLVPHVGLIRSAFLFGILNAGVGLLAIWAFRDKLKNHSAWLMSALACVALLLTGFSYSTQITSLAENNAYEGKIIFSKSSPYQRIILTRKGEDLSLFLNGNLQFSSRDEYRYHEALVHVGLSLVPHPKQVLVLGGGDGLAVREILKYPTIEKIILVDLDPTITELFSSLPLLTALNHQALLSPKVEVINHDAFLWLKNNRTQFDFIVVDFPDPSNYSVGKLYTTTFYHYLYQALKPQGLTAIQSTSPLVARKSYWCIEASLTESHFFVKPYITYVPAFGLWGFHLAAKMPIGHNHHLPKDLSYLTSEMLPSLFEIPYDIRKVDTEPNKLTNQILVRYFEEEWKQYVQ